MNNIPFHPIQHYKSLTDLIIWHHLILPRPHATWRLLVQPCVGSLNGLEKTFSGLAVATNGVIVALETSAGKILFAHLQWFVKDDVEQESDLDEAWETATRFKLGRLKAMKEMDSLFEECF